MDELPMLMIYRVSLDRRAQHNESHGFCDIFQSCFDTCGHDVFGKGIKDEHWDLVGMNIQDVLRQQRNPIRAQVQVMDAPKEWHALHGKGWSEEQAAQAIE